MNEPSFPQHSNQYLFADGLEKANSHTVRGAKEGAVQRAGGRSGLGFGLPNSTWWVTLGKLTLGLHDIPSPSCGDSRALEVRTFGTPWLGRWTCLGSRCPACREGVPTCPGGCKTLYGANGTGIIRRGKGNKEQPSQLLIRQQPHPS